MKDIVLCTDEGLAVRIGGGPVMSLPWGDVSRVQARRVDTSGLQPLVVAVEDETGAAVELNQGTDGWMDFIARVAGLAQLSTAELDSRLEALSVNDPPATLFLRA